MPASINNSKMHYKNVDKQYLTNLPYYGRHGQDKYLNEELFKNKKNGIFVDIGAYDGVESSNTLFFEESLGWEGICVEPLADAFQRLTANRKSVCINKCALDRPTTAKFMHVIPNKKSKLPEEGRHSNIEKLSGLLDFFTDQHNDLMEKKIQELGATKNYYDIECVPINKILELLPSQIDLLSIDCEGSEICILQSIDFSRFFIDVIVVEMLFPNEGFSNFMKNNGYSFIKSIGYDWVFKK